MVPRPWRKPIWPVPKEKLSDLAGLTSEKEQLAAIISFLADPAKYHRLGARLPTGILLDGPPGTGKTLLARALAGESGLPFITTNGSAFVQQYVGIGALHVRQLFRKARAASPCIVFIDEIDAVGKARSTAVHDNANEERESTLTQLLTEMSRTDENHGVLVVAATNRMPVLDDALTRRFDKCITLHPPTTSARREIVALHTKRIRTRGSEEVLCSTIAGMTPGFTGAAIAGLINEATMLAGRQDADAVDIGHFEEAFVVMVAGHVRTMRLNEQDRSRVAYHEAGHVTCAWFLEHADLPFRVSIEPRGYSALGHTLYGVRSDSDELTSTRVGLIHGMAVALAGRYCEEVYCSTATAGAADDLESVARTATDMVSKFGMGVNRYRSYPALQRACPTFAYHCEPINHEVDEIVEEVVTLCRSVIDEHKTQVESVAEALLCKKSLCREELLDLLGRPRQAAVDHLACEQRACSDIL